MGIARPVILHITPHMGGGVGKAISGVASSCDARHSVVLLEKPVLRSFLNATRDAGIDVCIQPDKTALSRQIEQADLVILHWWHNPQMAKFMAHFPGVETRLVIWSHISNLTVPALNPDFLSQVAMVWFATPASYDAGVFSRLPAGWIEERSAVVYGCAGLDDFPDIRPPPHQSFNIGYVGLIDYSKLHPDYLAFCKAVDIPGARFILAGEGKASGALESQMRAQMPDKGVEFLGYTDNVPFVLSGFDVFGYPLMPQHTCTTENAILEAMAARVPPVVIDQLAERHIVKDGETGLLVSGPAEYGRAMRHLFERPDIRRKLGQQARSHVLEKYSRSQMVSRFNAATGAALDRPKQRADFRPCMGSRPAEWFISCLGRDRQRFCRSLQSGISGQTPEILQDLRGCSPLLKQQNKGSVIQYARSFPDDPMLTLWADALKETIGVN